MALRRLAALALLLSSLSALAGLGCLGEPAEGLAPAPLAFRRDRTGPVASRALLSAATIPPGSGLAYFASPGSWVRAAASSTRNCWPSVSAAL